MPTKVEALASSMSLDIHGRSASWEAASGIILSNVVGRSARVAPSEDIRTLPESQNPRSTTFHLIRGALADRGVNLIG